MQYPASPTKKKTDLNNSSDINNSKINKVVLAFSGGLDTSAIIPWLKETYDAEVIAYCADLGNSPDKDYLEKWSKELGASAFVFDDLKEEFAKNYAFQAIKAGATYQQDYLLGTALARPLIASRMAYWAKQFGADAISHGATGKGNDQLRFEKSWAFLVPEMAVIAPWKLWSFTGRQDLADYLKGKGFLVDPKEKAYSVDVNLFHRSCEGGVLEKIEKEYQCSEILDWIIPAEQSTNQFTDIQIEFSKGLPVSLNGQKLSAEALLTELNKVAGEAGIGVADLVEERNIGVKSRGIYETPGGTVLHFSMKTLKAICWSRPLFNIASHMSQQLGDLIYDGHWHTDAAEAIFSFFDHSAKTLNGSIKLRLGKGQIKVLQRQSTSSLYDENAVSFESDSDGFNQAALGYCKMSSIGQKIQGKRLQTEEEVGKNGHYQHAQ